MCTYDGLMTATGTVSFFIAPLAFNLRLPVVRNRPDVPSSRRNRRPRGFTILRGRSRNGRNQLGSLAGATMRDLSVRRRQLARQGGRLADPGPLSSSSQTASRISGRSNSSSSIWSALRDQRSGFVVESKGRAQQPAALSVSSKSRAGDQARDPRVGVRQSPPLEVL